MSSMSDSLLLPADYWPSADTYIFPGSLCMGLHRTIDSPPLVGPSAAAAAGYCADIGANQQQQQQQTMDALLGIDPESISRKIATHLHQAYANRDADQVSVLLLLRESRRPTCVNYDIENTSNTCH